MTSWQPTPPCLPTAWRTARRCCPPPPSTGGLEEGAVDWQHRLRSMLVEPVAMVLLSRGCAAANPEHALHCPLRCTGGSG